MILNGRNVTLAEVKNYGAHQLNLNEDRSILSAAKCRLVILVSSNINYLRIFAGFHQGGCVKYSKSKLRT